MKHKGRSRGAINKPSFSGLGEDRQSQIHRKGCFTFIAISVVLKP